MTGNELRTHRKAAGLTQQQLAERAGFSRDTVQYWERKAVVECREVAPRRLCEVLGVQGYPTPIARAGGWGLTPNDISSASPARAAGALCPEGPLCAAPDGTHQPALCNARTRKGLPCRNKTEPGRTRCKFHGGKSTGPNTPQGRARVADAQRRRWVAWRAAASIQGE
ncbi:helix-turn-helix domain-containing protein [Rubellimicrobium roseum]|uniref:Helix-turn-helix domain-containing protein n=1 Tax=Rubellimicrobium roseum TaxID=687525 RepID=A0A5C4NDS2_9RHOB|nr:helix-turn-helix domain-containing protein [Rubellimicrobium roseum]